MLYLQLCSEKGEGITVNFGNVLYFEKDAEQKYNTVIHFIDGTQLTVRESYQNLSERIVSLDSLRR